MDYLKNYMNIINNALQQKRTKNKNYELHHIKPASLFPEIANLKLFPNNGVFLTHREHFICHMLLLKIYPCKEMNSAFVLMSKFYKLNSRQYETNQKKYFKFNWYNNGEFSIKLPISETPPKNFIPGLLIKKQIVQARHLLNKNKVIEKKLGKKQFLGSTVIIDLKTKKIYKSITDASEKTGLSYFLIRLSIDEKRMIKNHMFAKYNYNLDNNQTFDLLFDLYMNNTIIATQYRNKIKAKMHEVGSKNIEAYNKLRQSISYENYTSSEIEKLPQNKQYNESVKEINKLFPDSPMPAIYVGEIIPKKKNKTKLKQEKNND